MIQRTTTGGLAALSLALLSLTGGLLAQSKLMNLVTVEGVQTNEITGIGLVAGLNGTGDGNALTQQAVENFLRRGNLSPMLGTVSTDNLALVFVRAELPPFVRPGARIDVTVSSLNGASSLRGGTLIQAQMKGPQGQDVYALASGNLVTGGISAGGASGSSTTIDHPTVGSISGGAEVTKAVPQPNPNRILARDGSVTLLMRKPSYGTARNIVKVLDRIYAGSARAVDGGTVRVVLPPKDRKDPVGFLARIFEQVVQVETPAVVVISERTGTIVAGGDVVILPGVVSHSNLTISVTETPQVSQPNPLAGGETVVVPQTDISIREDGTPLIPVGPAVGARQLADTLNALGASTQDMITIFQKLDEAGLVQAEIRVR